MSRTVARGLGLVALVLLVLLAWLQWRSDRAAAPGTLLALAPDKVHEVRIVLPGQPEQVYRRRQGHWLVGDTSQRVPKGGRLDRIADLAAAPVQRWRPIGAMDLHTLGLKPPLATIYLDGQRLEFGVMTPFDPSRYVRVGDRIAVIPAQYSPQLNPSRRIGGSARR